MIPETVANYNPNVTFTVGKNTTFTHRTPYGEKILKQVYSSPEEQVALYTAGNARVLVPDGAKISYTVNYDYDAGELVYNFELTDNLDKGVKSDLWQFAAAIIDGYKYTGNEALGVDRGIVFETDMMKVINSRSDFINDSRLDLEYTNSVFEVDYSEYQVLSNEWYFASRYYIGVSDGHLFFSITPSTKNIFNRSVSDLFKSKGINIPSDLDEVTENSFAAPDLEKAISDLEALGFARSTDLDR